MPMTVLEAMSHGCFCLTSDIPENRDVLDGAGLTFEAGNVRSLRAALEGAMKDERREALGAAARRRSKLFGWDAVVEETLALYGADTNEEHPANGGMMIGQPGKKRGAGETAAD
jgi:glycosyltransferase involved in cell wall biosynthesis